MDSGFAACAAPGMTNERAVGWAKRSVPTGFRKRSGQMVGTARRAFAHPTNPRSDLPDGRAAGIRV